MENSDKKQFTNFFENLWPQILDYNECDIQSSNTAEYFMPKKPFDNLWAHQFLASKCYNNYEPSIELRKKRLAETLAKVKAEEETEQLPYRETGRDILPLDQQLACVQEDVEIRERLANDFANRTFPWYIQRPSYPSDFPITEETKTIFKDHFQLEILRNIRHFKCHIMIIDVAPDVPLENLECWLKFSPYVTIVTVIHDRELYEEVKNCKQIFQPILLEESPENSWHDELKHSIDRGIEKVKELFLLEEVGRPMVFVFSHNRGICVCNKFQIIRKS